MKAPAAVAALLLAAVLAAVSPAVATEATIALSGTEGSITLTATAEFTAYEHCNDETPPACTTVDSGSLRVSASHPHHSVAFQSVYLTGNGTMAWSVDLNAGRLAQGTHTFRAEARDSEGVTDEAVVVLEIDNTPIVELDPVGAVAGPFDITGRVRFKENVSGEEGVLYIYQLIPGYAAPLGQLTVEGTDIEFSFAQICDGQMLDGGALANGEHTYRARAVSVMGVYSEPAEVEVTIDNTPVVSMDLPDEVRQDFDPGGSVAFEEVLRHEEGTIELYFDGVSLGIRSCTDAAVTWQYSDFTGEIIDVETTAAGEHSLRLVATAYNGQRSEKTHVFRIENLSRAANRGAPACPPVLEAPGGTPQAIHATNHPFAGNPVNFAAGNKFHREVDFDIPYPELPIRFERYYNSHNEESGLLGYGWTANFFCEKLVFSAGEARLTQADGREAVFLEFADGRWESPTDRRRWIHLSGDGRYYLHEPDGATKQFDSAGRLRLEKNHNGSTYRWFYRGSPWSVIYSHGPRLDLYTDGSDRLVRMATPAGDFLYAYDAAGNLAAVEKPDGSRRSYLYEDPNDPHNLTGIVDETGLRVGTYAYDGQDRAVLSEGADGAGRVTVVYGNNFERTVTDSMGEATAYHLWTDHGMGRIASSEGPGCASCGGHGAAFEYDERFLPVRQTDRRGTITEFTYDDRGNVLTRTEAAGTDEERTTTYTWDPDTARVTAISRSSVAAPGQTAVSTFVYDPRGNLLSRTDTGYDDAGPVTRTTAWTWDAYGQVTSADGPRTDVADVATFEYFPMTADQGSDRGMLRRVTDPLGHTTTFAGYNAWRRPGRITDPNGVTTNLSYDLMGRLISAETAGRVTTYDHDAAGRLTAVHGADGRALHYAYTPDGRLASVADDPGNRVVYTYDTEGNRIREEIYDPDGNPGRALDFDFDAENRLAAIRYPNGGVETRTYDAGGLLTATTDTGGRTTLFAYDPLGRLVQTIQPGGLTTVFDYNGHDDLTGVTDAEGHATTYTMDDLGRVTARSSPDTGTTLYRCDPSGNLVRKTDAGGVTVDYTYDAAGRLMRTDFPDDAQDVVFTYDEGDYSKGRLTGMTDPSGVAVYRYDLRGDLVAEEKTVAGVTYTTTYEYDEAGRPTAVGYPDGTRVDLARNAAGRIAGATATREGEVYALATGARYRPFGPLASLTLGGGLTREVDHDLRYRPVRIRVGDRLDYAYTWDGTGNITAIADGLEPTRSRSFGYDALDRLTGAAGPFGTIAYTYDGIGNRLSKTVDGATDVYSYVPGTSRLAAVTGPGAAVFEHDANGSMVRMGDRDLVYNQNHRLSRVEENGVPLGEYVYNGQGQRILKTTAEGTVVFHYDLDGNLIGESDVQGDFKAVYVYLDGERLAALAPPSSDTLDVRVITDKGRHLAGIRVYAFTGTGAYTGRWATTDENGAARFTTADLGAGRFTFRADYLGGRFWSDAVDLPGPSAIDVEIPEETVEVDVTMGGAPAANVRVYLFSSGGSYLGVYTVTDAGGRAAFDVPSGAGYRFRADLLGGRFMSDACAVVSGVTNTFALPTGGGDLTVRLEEAVDTPLAGVRLYLFSAAGSYLGCRGDTDSAGRVVFDVPAGSYKVRADYLGQRFWSDTVVVAGDTGHVFALPHADVRIAVAGDLAGDVAPLAGVRAYLFTAGGGYTGRYADTDENGEALFRLPAADFKVRADYCGGRFWSPVFHFADAAVTIPEAEAAVRVTGMGLGLAGVRVYAFNATGSYLGLYGETDGNGTLAFRLPAADYDFRADYLGSRYYSGAVTLVAHESNPVTVSTGGGAFALNLFKRPGEPLAAVRCYLFDDADAYLGQYGNTSDQGRVDFNLADGRYRIRADHLNLRFWTGAFDVPATLDLDFVIPHAQTGVRVLGDCNGDLAALAGVRVYLFSPSDSYTGIYGDTDTAGELVLDIPTADFKLRADYLGGRFWQDVTGGVDTDLVIPEGVARVEVSQGSGGIENVKVYAFSESGSYLGRYGWTDAAGEVRFRLPAATYSFRADHLGSRYWAVAAIAPHLETPVPLDTGGGTFTLSVTRGAGVPLPEVPVYAFTVSGSYIGLSSRTDDAGVATFALSDGGYSFRADYLGHRFWLDHVTVPDRLTDTLEIPHEAVSVSVNALYDGSVTPLPDIKTYLFTETGSYTGRSLTTDADGEVVYDLPDAAFKVRADYCGGRFWSDTVDPYGTDLDIEHGVLSLTVQASGSPVQDVPVYLFNESGTYLGQREYTDAAGQAEFFVPEGAYKLRIDHASNHHWTDVLHPVPHETTTITLNLGELALNSTNDPNPTRYDGRPPERDTPLLASLIDIQGVLAQSALAYTDNFAVYYFINDHLGTPQKVVDDSGAVVWDGDYEPFGKIISSSGPWNNRFRFPGQSYDSETGLHYNYHRCYDNQIGRYLTPDPVGLAGGANPYSYAKNDPLIWIDPNGRIPILAALPLAWAVIETALSAYDIYDTATTLSDPCIGGGEKATAVGLFALGIALPGGGYSQVDNLAKASNKLSRKMRRLAEANISDNGITVLGSFRPSPGKMNYIQKATTGKYKGSSYFDIGDAWNPIEGTVANRYFLDIVGGRGDKIVFSVPKKMIRPETSLAMEVEYLKREYGYNWVNQWSMQRR